MLLSICGTLCLTGCFSLETAKEPGMKHHIFASNYGWYLFNFIPIIGGNASENPWTPFVLFRNDVKMDIIQRRLLNEAASQNRRVDNLVWNNYETVIFSFPGSSIDIPIPYILTYREMQLSGEMK